MSNLLFRSAQPHELPQVLDLIDTAFTHYTETPDVANGRSHVELFTAVYNRPDLDPELIVVAEDTATGRLVSMASLLPKPAQIGTREINGVVLSPVGTLPDYRGRGIAEQLLRFGLQLAKEKGFTFSCVLGHPTYYPRVGYVSAFPWYRLSQTLPEQLTAGADTRAFQNGDLHALSEIYNRESSGFFLTPTRSLNWWETELAHLGEQGRCFTDLQVFTQGEEIIGYASLGEADDKLVLKEVSVSDNAHAPAVLNALYTLASTRGKTKLQATFPATTSLGLHLKRQGATETIHAPSAWMFQVLNWETWLEAYAIYTGMGMQLTYDEINHQLYVDGELSPTLQASPEALTKLTLGLHTSDELEILGLLTGQDSHRLFPKRAPYFNLNEALF
ncbi:GNAT family N-acetyltransferase [Tumebacillus sp. ITR2]|uniref:GNAT family N-acetyltransferase n=1 Tax=Tumebacillus amylolyticus TaxID=2801339 RepID=A0ABS1J4T2_9BACL|nr:GNAT family N-acetyltransferase [Tumebacillus amylolyticus]MBL0385289.1 GNAT family N-acetyltransferase [Tumebacillus amylolyticus]